MAYVTTGYVTTGYVSDVAIPDGYPLQSDVRFGVTYGASLEYTGTYTTADAGAIADAVLAAAKVEPIHSEVKKVNGGLVVGDGSEVDPWRKQGVVP